MTRSLSETNIVDDNITTTSVTHALSSTVPINNFDPPHSAIQTKQINEKTTMVDTSNITVIRSDEAIHDIYHAMKISSADQSGETSHLSSFNSPRSFRIVHLAGTFCFLKPSKYSNFFASGNILVHSGDFCKYGKYEEFVLFDSWLESMSSRFPFRVVVIGESDSLVYGTDWERYKSMLPHATHVLCDEMCEILGLKIYGHGYRQPTPTSFMASFRNNRIISNIPTHDILISSQPSYGYLDTCHHAGHIQHNGNRNITDIIKRNRVTGLHLHGGCAESRGVLFPSSYNAPLAINSCMCDPDQKVMYGSPHVIKCAQVTIPEAIVAGFNFSMDNLYV